MAFEHDAYGLFAAELAAMRREPFSFAVFGHPGCGKTYLATQLRDIYGLVHIHVGQLINDAVTARRLDELGEEMKEHLLRGSTVPNDLVWRLLVCASLVWRSVGAGHCRHLIFISALPTFYTVALTLLSCCSTSA